MGRAISAATPLHWIQPLSPIPKGEIFFAEGSAALSDESKIVLDQVAKELLDHPAYKVILYGHADPFEGGSPRGAWDLGLKRALAAMYHLIGQGVPAERLRPDSRGSEYLILTHDSPEARAGMRMVTTEVQLPEPRSNQLCFGMCG
jgi:outer membrane protein OmpA-like peptidoglycan-associated protein